MYYNVYYNITISEYKLGYDRILSGIYLHRAKRGNFPPSWLSPPPSNFLGYMYTIKQPMSMIFLSNATTLRTCSRHIHL